MVVDFLPSIFPDKKPRPVVIWEIWMDSCSYSGGLPAPWGPSLGSHAAGKLQFRAYRISDSRSGVSKATEFGALGVGFQVQGSGV